MPVVLQSQVQVADYIFVSCMLATLSGGFFSHAAVCPHPRPLSYWGVTRLTHVHPSVSSVIPLCSDFSDFSDHSSIIHCFRYSNDYPKSPRAWSTFTFDNRASPLAHFYGKAQNMVEQQ